MINDELDPIHAHLVTMTQDAWNRMSVAQREASRDLSGLNPQLTGLEGCRVEAVTLQGNTRRFIVGRSTGWRPCHIEIARRDSMGGGTAEGKYASIRRLCRVFPS